MMGDKIILKNEQRMIYEHLVLLLPYLLSQ